MPFEPIKLAPRGTNRITLDKLGRVMLSKRTRVEMKLDPYQYVVAAIDVDKKRVGLAKQELAKVPNATAVKMDKRGYLSPRLGKMIAVKLALNLDQAPHYFEYIGRIDEGGVYWYGFELVDEAALGKFV